MTIGSHLGSHRKRMRIAQATLAAILLGACGGGGEEIRGTVTDAEGDAASSIDVGLYGREDQGPEDEAIAETTTDDEGRFEFGGVQPGEYFISLGVDVPDVGACKVAHLLTVEEGGAADADIELPSTYPQIASGSVGLLITGDLIFC